MPSYDYRCENCGIIEIFHGMTEEDKTTCPECDSPNFQKMMSSVGGIIIGGREANQYNDVKAAKYWRDKNGIRHKVTEADGHSGSATVNRQTATPDEVKARKKKDRKTANKQRLKMQKERTDAWNKENLK